MFVYRLPNIYFNMMSFLTVLGPHISTRRSVLYPEPLAFKPKPRPSSKRTNLVHQQHSAPGSQSTGVGAHRGAGTTHRQRRGAAAAVLLPEKTVCFR